jgi:glycosyltransferase involved in cell wall biosynthesis
MTEALKSFFLSAGHKKEKLLLIPQTIDIERFNKDHKLINNYNFDYIAYTGSLSEQKDGVISLVKAFEIVARKYSNLYLLIFGTGSPEDRRLLSSEINKFSMNDRILLKDSVASNVIPDILKNAKLLVSCRPYSIQAEFGFPTKVIEYLACQKPVVTTVAGDLTHYLKDNVNAYISKSSSPEDFSSKIINVLDNYDSAIIIAARGKELVQNMFNPQIHTLKIINYKA